MMMMTMIDDVDDDDDAEEIITTLMMAMMTMTVDHASRRVEPVSSVRDHRYRIRYTEQKDT
jgi:hypothetical protein